MRNHFEDLNLIYTGLVLGIILLVVAMVSEKRNIKKHFVFTYCHFATHILFISGLAGMFMHETFLIGWFLLLLLVAYLIYRQAIKMHSFYLLLLICLYLYIALGYLVITILDKAGGVDLIYFGLMYFIISAIGLVRLLIGINHKMKVHDSL